MYVSHISIMGMVHMINFISGQRIEFDLYIDILLIMYILRAKILFFKG